MSAKMFATTTLSELALAMGDADSVTIDTSTDRMPKTIDEASSAIQLLPVVVVAVCGIAVVLAPGVDRLPPLAGETVESAIELLRWIEWGLNLPAVQAIATFVTLVGFIELLRRGRSA